MRDRFVSHGHDFTRAVPFGSIFTTLEEEIGKSSTHEKRTDEKRQTIYEVSTQFSISGSRRKHNNRATGINRRIHS